MFFRAAVRGLGVAIGVSAAVGAGATVSSWHQLSAEAKYAQTTPRHGHTSDPKQTCLERSTWDSNWDRRHTAAASHDDEAPMPTATRHLLLIRHGQYVMEGSSDDQRVLTELGRKQAAATGQRLAVLGLPLTRIVVSNMKRARETATIIAQSLPNVAVSYHLPKQKKFSCALARSAPSPVYQHLTRADRM
jgi:serine/threonine-protein phosphatase PGAM5